MKRRFERVFQRCVLNTSSPTHWSTCQMGVWSSINSLFLCALGRRSQSLERSLAGRSVARSLVRWIARSVDQSLDRPIARLLVRSAARPLDLSVARLPLSLGRCVALSLGRWSARLLGRSIARSLDRSLWIDASTDLSLHPS